MRYGVILFDNDNTAQRTEAVAFGVVAKVLNRFFAASGHAHTVEALPLQKRYAGDQMPEICRHLFCELGVAFTDANIAAIAEENRYLTIPAMRDKSEATPGMMEETAKLVKAGYAIAMVTSSEITRVQAGLDKTGLNKFFPGLFHEGGNVFTVPNSLAHAKRDVVPKPDPAVYKLALEMLGFNPSEAIAVEDSASGVKAGVAAGIDVIGYTGADPLNDIEREALTQKLLAAGAKVVIHHMDQLLTTVRQLETLRTAALLRGHQHQNA